MDMFSRFSRVPHTGLFASQRVVEAEEDAECVAAETPQDILNRRFPAFAFDGASVEVGGVLDK